VPVIPSSAATRDADAAFGRYATKKKTSAMQSLYLEKTQITQKNPQMAAENPQLTAQEPAWVADEQEKTGRSRGIKDNFSVTASTRGQEEG
jgi:hypothetical protein